MKSFEQGELVVWTVMCAQIVGTVFMNLLLNGLFVDRTGLARLQELMISIFIELDLKFNRPI
jgi:hypothetical protein